MPGQGKYSKFTDVGISPSDKDKLDFLDKLFKGGPKLALADVVARAKAFLVPPTQTADVQMFPGGQVSLDYAASPDLDDVKWNKAGDPSTPYTPDVRSPGSAVATADLGNIDVVNTNLVPQGTDPGLKVAELASPGYVPAAPGTGTKSPNDQAVKVAADTLGTSLSASDVTDNSGGEIYK